MARAPNEEPQGLIYRPELISVEEEARLLEVLDALRFGVSLLGSSRLRFQRGTGSDRRIWEVFLQRRSGYVLAEQARTSWQHSIPPVKELRCSITFRTLRRPRAKRS